jgi:hypothetical protein
MGGTGSGRAPDEGSAREFTLRVRMTDEDRAQLDAARGTRTRSAFARDALRAAIGRLK